MTLVSNTDVEKSWVFCRVKIPYPKFLTFLSFMNIFRSSHLQMFFKIGALKKFAVFLTKESLQHRCFPANIAKFWRTGFLQNFSVGCFCIILKVIKQLFCKGFFKEISLLWCPNNFYSRHISERRIVWCIKKKLVCLQICR